MCGLYHTDQASVGAGATILRIKASLVNAEFVWNKLFDSFVYFCILIVSLNVSFSDQSIYRRLLALWTILPAFSVVSSYVHVFTFKRQYKLQWLCIHLHSWSDY